MFRFAKEFLVGFVVVIVFLASVYAYAAETPNNPSQPLPHPDVQIQPTPLSEVRGTFTKPSKKAVKAAEQVTKTTTTLLPTTSTTIAPP